jgi:dihydroorotate dehydrogenase (fumarate)
MTQSLRWVSLLSNQVESDLAGNTGIHETDSVIKHLMVGAAAVQVCTILYKNGISYLDKMITDLEAWLQNHNYSSISHFQGKITPDMDSIAAFERVQYMKKTLTE